MRALTETEIRASFVNCTKGEAARAAVPKDLAGRPWADLDFLGWSDPAAPQKAYVVAVRDEQPVGVALRLAAPAGGRTRRTMCSLCLTAHPGDGVVLMTARKAGRSGQHGDSVGTYLCRDLACSLYLRGLKKVGFGGRLPESLSVAEQAERLTTAWDAFLATVRS